MDRVKRQLSTRPVDAKTTDELVEHINRDLYPLIRELRQRLNEAIDRINALEAGP